MSRVKYPIGIQTFEKIREGNYLYVDKTRYIHELASSDSYYFLSRPRRFGKSLTISTLLALFEGKRELFKGLAIDSLEWNWKKHEVLHLDLNVKFYEDKTSLVSILDRHLREWEEKYEIIPNSDAYENRFVEIIKKAYSVFGRGVVILVDEYDKPLLATIGDPELQNYYRKQLQGFYGVLKSMDPYIRFGMITGVSRFSKVSIFSALNNLKDISLSNKYNAICGITESELSEYFAEGIREMAAEEGVSVAQLHESLKSNYDGYHFSGKGKDIYNPFSILNVFSDLQFGSYWLATGTTSSLLEVLNVNTYPLQELEGCKATENMLNGADIFLSDPIPFFFQTGYLTIKDYNPEFKRYTLGFPNREVTEGFNDLVLRTWMRKDNPATFVEDFVNDVRDGKAEAFMEKIKYFFAGIPYDHAKGDKAEKEDEENGICGSREVHYQNVLYVIMKLMGFYTNTEYRTSNGRIDMVVQTSEYVYVMEFKIDSSAQAALDQIEEKGYADPFRITGKKIFRIGANFNTKTRRLSDYIIV
ncbi:MAG: ATP-binding protein [Muribaculum sp.]|nr:ATP-binding protein [Muribaculum sp.]